MSKKFFILLSLVLAFTLCAAGGAPAAQFPARTIEVLYHSSVGSGGDIMLRAMDQALLNASRDGKIRHVGWVINNMPGGAGARSWEYTARSATDGYTILGISSTILTSPLMNEMEVNYESFEPIAMVLIDPMVVAVPGDSKFNTFEELIADAKANPGTQSWAGGVAGELGFVAGLEVMKYFGCSFNLVPFEGGADAAASLMGGHLTAAIGEYAELSEAAESGLVKIIASFNKLSVAGWEDTPTMEDLGQPDINIVKIRGLLGPKNMDKDVLAYIRQQVSVMVEEESFKQYAESNGLTIDVRFGDDFTEIMKDQTEVLIQSLISAGIIEP